MDGRKENITGLVNTYIAGIYLLYILEISTCFMLVHFNKEETQPGWRKW